MNQYLDLFLTFARVGVMTFGGGYAMLPILEREVVDGKGWATSEELMDYYAVGQCTPGVIAVNTATFIGQKQAGNLGGIVATLGIVFPSLVIITAIAGVLTNFSHLAVVQNAFAAMSEGGKLGITSKNQGDFISLRIKDNGCGIPEDKLSKIFEPYYTTKASGTGLGLTLVYKIMKEHNGDIHVKSELGKGTEFILDFPVPVSERKALKGGEE